MTVFCNKIKNSLAQIKKVSKELGLNQSNLKQQHAKLRPNRPSKHDKSASRKLIGKKKDN
jgi:hypothetical protein